MQTLLVQLPRVLAAPTCARSATSTDNMDYADIPDGCVQEIGRYQGKKVSSITSLIRTAGSSSGRRKKSAEAVMTT